MKKFTQEEAFHMFKNLLRIAELKNNMHHAFIPDFATDLAARTIKEVLTASDGD